jgi:hypothetical protein
MNIALSGEVLSIGRDSVRVNARYVTAADVVALSKVWLDRLKHLRHRGEQVQLPFSVDDEYVEAFVARLEGRTVSLRVVHLEGIGFDHGIDNLVEHAVQARRIVKECAYPMGQYDIDVFTEAIERFAKQA